MTKLTWLSLLLLLNFSVETTAKPEIVHGGVLMQYHHVHASTPISTSISPETFSLHMKTIVDEGYRIWPLTKLLDAITQQAVLPDKVVSITFDDAYIDIYDNAFPILKQNKLPFTIFVATQLVGRNGYLTWDHIREMKSAGASIANHTHSHAHLVRMAQGESKEEWLGRITKEIVLAQEIIERELGPTPKQLAYPYGEYNPEVLALVAELGYIGVGQQSGPASQYSSMLVLPRFPFSGPYSAMKSFRTKLNTLPFPIVDNSLDPILENDDIPTLSLQLLEGNYRVSEVTCYGPGGMTELINNEHKTLIARNKTPLPIGRSRYNCTMPATQGNRYHWYSQLWMKKNTDQSWYAE
jgi:biofilm PGA synthesis lipoprotein PgaB